MANKDHRGSHTGAFVRLPHSLLTTQAYRAASPTARALLVDLVLMEKGKNNGTLFLSVRDAANRLGLSDLRAAGAAINELERLGFIAMTADAHFSSRATDGSRARSWRLTWLPCKAAPTNEYQTVQVADRRARLRAERGCRALKAYMRKQNGGQETTTRFMESVVETRTLAGNTPVSDTPVVRETATLEMETPLVSVDPPCSGNHYTYSLPSTGTVPARSNHAGNTAGADPAAVSPDLLATLRRQVQAYLATAGVGAQTRLAEFAGIPGGTLSKFVGGRGLGQGHFVKLQLELNALTAVATTQSKRKAA